MDTLKVEIVARSKRIIGHRVGTLLSDHTSLQELADSAHKRLKKVRDNTARTARLDLRHLPNRKLFFDDATYVCREQRNSRGFAESLYDVLQAVASWRSYPTEDVMPEDKCWILSVDKECIYVCESTWPEEDEEHYSKIETFQAITETALVCEEGRDTVDDYLVRDAKEREAEEASDRGIPQQKSA